MTGDLTSTTYAADLAARKHPANDAAYAPLPDEHVLRAAIAVWNTLGFLIKAWTS